MRDRCGKQIATCERAWQGAASAGRLALMRAPVHLTFEAMVALLCRTFERLPDARRPERVTYAMRDAATTAFACFFFQQPSLLKHQRDLARRAGRSNLETIF